MSVTFKVNFPSTDEAGVREYESLIGFSLPAEYREFLLKINGGKKPDPNGTKISAVLDAAARRLL